MAPKTHCNISLQFDGIGMAEYNTFVFIPGSAKVPALFTFCADLFFILVSTPLRYKRGRVSSTFHIIDEKER